MQQNPDFRRFAWFIIVSGAALSFATAAVPHFDAGYRLHLGVLFAGLLPYVVYASFSDVVRGWALLAAGALLLGIDLGVKIPERFLHYDAYASGRIYFASLVMTLVAVLVLGIAARREHRWWGKKEKTQTKPD
ncbi:MAG TPA: hypothetical protein VLG93_07285 [Sulfuricaulis sp.]|nr:hypothetical protein [Sulfuricaulis sp.]